MRRRHMFHATGLPGWMRFGYSPGWAGRSPSGLGPCAEYMMTGQWPTPQMQAAWQGAPAGFRPDPQAQLEMLRQHAGLLEEQLTFVRQQIEEHNRNNTMEAMISLSVGCATAEKHESLIEAYKTADANMYQAKQKKKDNLKKID